MHSETRSLEMPMDRTGPGEQVTQGSIRQEAIKIGLGRVRVVG